MKKLNRKLIPAFAMLLLSAVLMSTASFAWFSSNGQVKASGLAVSATAPAALWISADNNTYGTTATFTNTKTLLSPVTDDIGTNDATNASSWGFYALTTLGMEKIDKNGEIAGQKLTAENLGEDANALGVADKTNYICQPFYLRYEGKNDGTNIDKATISAKVIVDKVGDTTADDIWKALRVAIVVPKTAGNASVGGYAVYEVAGLGNTIDTAITGESTNVLLTIAAQETVNVYVYVWFEGNDDDCTNNNSFNATNYSVALEFNATPVVTQQNNNG